MVTRNHLEYVNYNLSFLYHVQNPLFVQRSLGACANHGSIVHAYIRLRRFIVLTQQTYVTIFGVIQVLRNAVCGVGGYQITQKKCYGGVQFNVISATGGWVGCWSNFQEKLYVTLE